MRRPSELRFRVTRLGPDGDEVAAGGDGQDLPVVYVVSDSIGETADYVVRAAASQFNAEGVEIRRVSYVESAADIDAVISQAREIRSIIVFTIIVPHLRDTLREKAAAARIPAVDIMGPTMEAMAGLMSTPPKLQPGLVHRLDEEYFRRIEAVEFAVKYDDGKDPKGLLKADIVLIGVSRTSKTPVSMYLAHRRYKVANLPLVPETSLPEELFRIPPGKVVGLTIRPQELHRIRRERLKAIGLDAGSSYADPRRIMEELEYAESVFSEIGCAVVDVTNKAVEETATTVLDILKGRDRDGG